MGFQSTKTTKTHISNNINCKAKKRNNPSGKTARIEKTTAQSEKLRIKKKQSEWKNSPNRKNYQKYSQIRKTLINKE